MDIVRVFTGPDGRSHFEDLTIPLDDFGRSGRISDPWVATGVQFRTVEGDYLLDFHTAPRRQLVVNLTGSVEIEVGDGTKRVLGPGTILLAEDTTGQGHISRSVDGQPRACLFVHLEAADAPMTVARADALAQQAHGDSRTRSGSLFIEHVRRVAKRFADDPDRHAQTTALLHDTVEKTQMSWDDLRAAGADERLIRLVDALTERDGEPEHIYLARAAADPLTLRIKRADIEDKLDPVHHADLAADQAHLMRSRASRRLALLDRLAAAAGSAPPGPAPEPHNSG